jgi:hypothetical protein
MPWLRFRGPRSQFCHWHSNPPPPAATFPVGGRGHPHDNVRSRAGAWGRSYEARGVGQDAGCRLLWRGLACSWQQESEKQ